MIESFFSPPARNAKLVAVLAPAIVAISIAVLPGSPMAQTGMHNYGNYFDLSVSQTIDAEKGSVIVVNAALGYRRLVFFRKGDSYEARYRVYVDLEKKDGRAPAGEVWEETVTVGTYRESRSPDMRALIRRSFPADAGRYEVKVIIEVLGTSRKYERKQKIRVVGGDDDMIQLSSPVFYSPVPGHGGSAPAAGELLFSVCGGQEEDFREVSGGVYVDFDGWMRISTGMIAPGANPDSPISVSCRITDSRGKTVVYNRQVLSPGSRVSNLCFDMDVGHLQIGFYTCSISAVQENLEEKTTREEPFVILLNRALFLENFPDLISLLSIIADKEDLSALSEAPVEQRRAEWKLFWERREPSSAGGVNESLSEFLRRVKYTLRAFSKRGPGWETDMGKVFIRNGAPDRVTDRAGNQYAIGSAYQLWYYDSMGLVYIFQNTMGGGEYRLVDKQMY